MAGAESWSRARTGTLIASVVVFAGLALFVNPAEQLLLSPHECRVLETAREMAETGDWIVPRFNGEIRLQKPPLPYWCSGAAYALVGEPSVGAARCVVAGLGLLTLLGTLVLGTTIFDLSVGAAAMATLAGGMLFLEEFRRVTTDPYLAAFTTLAAAAIAGAWRLPPRRARRWGAAATIALALALLAKGPIALGFGALALFGTKPPGRRVPWGRVALAAGLALLPMIGWGLAVVLRIPDGLAVWKHELSARIPGEAEGNRSPVVYAGTLLLALAPATLPFLATFLPRSSAAGRTRQWFLIGFAVLVAMPSRKDAYLLPLLPVAAVLAARVLLGGAAAAASRVERIVALAHVIVVPAAVLAFGGMILARETWTSWPAGIGVGVGGLIAVAVIGALFHGRTPVALVLLAGIAATGLWEGVWRGEGLQDLSRANLGRLLRERVPEGEPLVAIGVRDPVVAFYARRTPVPLPDDARAGSQPGVSVWVLTRRELAGRCCAVPADEVATTLGGFRQGADVKTADPGASLVLLRLPPGH